MSQTHHRFTSLSGGPIYSFFGLTSYFCSRQAVSTINANSFRQALLIRFIKRSFQKSPLMCRKGGSTRQGYTAILWKRFAWLPQARFKCFPPLQKPTELCHVRYRALHQAGYRLFCGQKSTRNCLCDPSFLIHEQKLQKTPYRWESRQSSTESEFQWKPNNPTFPR